MNNPGLKNKVETAVSAACIGGCLIISDNGMMKTIKDNFGNGKERINKIVRDAPEIVIGYYLETKLVHNDQIREYIWEDIAGECFY